MNKLTTIGALLGACALLITIQDASTVAADPTITLSVQLSTPTSVGIDGAAVLAAEQIDLEDGTHLLEPDGSHAAVANSGVGPVNLGAYAHSGGITSTGPVVFIRDGAHVHGDVVTAQAFAHQNVWHVDGNVHEGVLPPTLPDGSSGLFAHVGARAASGRSGCRRLDAPRDDRKCADQEGISGSRHDGSKGKVGDYHTSPLAAPSTISGALARFRRRQASISEHPRREARASRSRFTALVALTPPDSPMFSALRVNATTASLAALRNG